MAVMPVQPSGFASGLATGNPVFTYNGKATVEHKASDCTTEVDLTEPGILSGGKKHKVCLHNSSKDSWHAQSLEKY